MRVQREARSWPEGAGREGARGHILPRVQTPWWVKIGAKIVLSRLPAGYSVWQKLGLFRHGAMDRSDYAMRIFGMHQTLAGLTDLTGKTVLEVGPGDSVSTALIAKSLGAQSVLVDVGSFARSDMAPYRELARTLNGRAPDLSACHGLADLLKVSDARYLTHGLQSLQTIPSYSVDFIFSQAVLHVIRRREFAATVREWKRILKPSGVCSHHVHLADSMGGNLNDLRFSTRIWESEFMAKSGFYTNRIRYSKMLEVFRKAGFDAEIRNLHSWDRLPIERTQLASEFRDLSDKELAVIEFDVILRSPHI